MKTIELGQAESWRHLVHRHGSNLLGGLMVMVIVCGAALAVLAS
jgi:hypothetical protein